LACGRHNFLSFRPRRRLDIGLLGAVGGEADIGDRSTFARRVREKVEQSRQARKIESLRTSGMKIERIAKRKEQKEGEV